MKLWHKIIIVIGIIFLMLGAFHTNLWMDEAYTVTMARHTFQEIWQISGHDVHPVLYYWFLHIIYLIFGNSILLYRLFSVLMISILGILGYTHIRKDFGEKVGILFSFLVFFLPINLIHSTEIRMYTLAMLLVTLMFIYAYRLIKTDSKKQNWILFTIFSLASAYTHYYGLVTAGIINIGIFIYLILEARKEKKNDSTKTMYTTSLKYFTISAISQIALYLPWFIFFVLQVKQVSEGFWIGKPSGKALLELVEFQITGNLNNIRYLNQAVALILAVLLIGYILYCIFKTMQRTKVEKREEIIPGILAFCIYFVVILAIIFISFFIPVLYARYLLVITGLFIFGASFFMAKQKRNYLTYIICVILLGISIFLNISNFKINYDSNNQAPITFIKESIQKGDILVYGNAGSGFVVAANFPEQDQYFYNQDRWNAEQSYQCFGPNMKFIYDLQELKNVSR